MRSVGVVSSSGCLNGIVSQSDISGKVAAENTRTAWMKFSDIKTRELITVNTEKTLEDCLRLMEQNSLFHLTVLDQRQGFPRMLSVTDLLQIIASDEKARANLLEAFIFTFEVKPLRLSPSVQASRPEPAAGSQPGITKVREDGLVPEPGRTGSRSDSVLTSCDRRSVWKRQGEATGNESVSFRPHGGNRMPSLRRILHNR